MTPDRASPHRKPAGGRRQPDYTLVRSILRHGPPIAPTSTGLGARDRRQDVGLPGHHVGGGVSADVLMSGLTLQRGA
jgi:hypothetical protein